jgi:hypothetical protein
MTESHRHYAFARHALVTALRLARVGRGGTVLVPDFICRDVLASLTAVGAQPIFYSIDVDLQPNVHHKLPDADAIIVVNYFGFPADLTRLCGLLTSSRTTIIEDNAHGWLSADVDGIPLGSRTAVGVTSLRKTVRIPDGALLEWRDDAPLDYAALHPPLIPRSESLPLGFILRRSVQQIDKRSPMSLMELGRRTVRVLRQVRGRPPVEERANEEWELPNHVAIHQTSLELIAKVDRITEIHRRRDRFVQCLSAAQRLGLETPTPVLMAGVSPQGFPFFGDSGNVTKFQRLVQRHRLGETISWPALPERSPLAPESRLRKLQLVNFLA